MGVTILPVKYVLSGKDGQSVVLAEYINELYGFEVAGKVNEERNQYVWASLGSDRPQSDGRWPLKYLCLWG